MLYTKLSQVVQAVRLRYAIVFVALLVGVYWVGIYPWMMSWGSTAAETQMALPGDDLSPQYTAQTTRALTISAPATVVWQWLIQIGQDRAGFYTYTWLENLTGVNIHNANTLHPEWQHLAVGDTWQLAPPEYLWGLGKGAATPVLLVEPGHALVLKMWGAFVIVPIDAHTSRLIVRAQSGPNGPVAGVAMKMVMDPIVFTMSRPMLLGIRARAEGRSDAPAALEAVAQLGWIAAAIAIAGLFVSWRRYHPWMALPVIAALPALLMARDTQAGLTAFIAAGIPVLGFLIFGRRWWGSFLVIASVVLLTLLLAPDAYIAIGLTFAVLLLAAGVEMGGERAGALGGAARRLASPTR